MFRKSVVFPLIGLCIVTQACSTTSGAGGNSQNTAVNRAIGKCVAGIAVSAAGGAVIGAILGNGGNSVQRGAIVGAAVGVGRCAILLELAAAEDKQKLQQAQLAALEVDQTTTQTIQTKSGRVATVTTKVTPAPPPPRKKKPKPKPKAVAVAPDPKPITPTPVPTADANQVAGVASASEQPSSKPVVVNGEPQTASTPQADQTSLSETAFFEQQPSNVECKFTELLINMDGSSTDTGKQKWCRSDGGAWEPAVG